MKLLFNRRKSLPSTEDANTAKPASLIFCVVMDLIGYATYSIPFLGEFGDILWAPISAFIFFKTFGGWKGAFGGVFNFIEELLPFLDFIPSFTIMWFIKSRSSLFAGKPVVGQVKIQ